MTTYSPSATERASRAAEEASRAAEQSRGVELAARAGYAAKGIVYSIIGLLAVQVGFGLGGRTTDTQGALHTIAQQSFGQILLILVGIGLVGYAAWRFVQAILNVEDDGSDAEGLVKRGFQLTSGLIYGSLAITAFRIVAGNGGGSGSSTETMTAKLLAKPFGAWLVGAAGLIVIVVGLRQFYRAYEATFEKKLRLASLNAEARTWVIRISRFGLAARGVVFSMIGTFLIVAAVRSNPDKAMGLDGALEKLAAQPYGPWLLTIVALGLVAYGLYCLIEARYRRIGTA